MGGLEELERIVRSTDWLFPEGNTNIFDHLSEGMLQIGVPYADVKAIMPKTIILPAKFHHCFSRVTSDIDTLTLAGLYSIVFEKNPQELGDVLLPCIDKYESFTIRRTVEILCKTLTQISLAFSDARNITVRREEAQKYHAKFMHLAEKIPELLAKDPDFYHACCHVLSLQDDAPQDIYRSRYKRSTEEISHYTGQKAEITEILRSIINWVVSC